MGNTQPHLRPGPVAAAAALALGIAVGPAAAEPGIFVSADGSTVSVTTTVCPDLGGFWGTAALLSAEQTSVAEGRRAELTGSAAGQSAVWQDVRPGTYTVIVVCADNVTAGTQAVTVSAAARPSASASPPPPPPPPPSRPCGAGPAGTPRPPGTTGPSPWRPAGPWWGPR